MTVENNWVTTLNKSNVIGSLPSLFVTYRILTSFHTYIHTYIHTRRCSHAVIKYKSCAQNNEKHLSLNAKVSQCLLKCRFLFYNQNNSFGDNAIEKPSNVVCIQHENQNGVACGCPALTRIVRQSTFSKSNRKAMNTNWSHQKANLALNLKSQSYNTLHFMRKTFLVSGVTGRLSTTQHR